MARDIFTLTMWTDVWSEHKIIRNFNTYTEAVVEAYSSYMVYDVFVLERNGNRLWQKSKNELISELWPSELPK